MLDPDAAVHELLDAAVIDGLTKSTRRQPPFNGNLCLCSLVEVEDNGPFPAVFVSPLPGGMNNRFLGTSSDHRVEYVLIEVRGRDHDEAGALALARACWTALNYANATAHGYYCCAPIDPQPQRRGEDAGLRTVLSFQVELRRTT